MATNVFDVILEEGRIHFLHLRLSIKIEDSSFLKNDVKIPANCNLTHLVFIYSPVTPHSLLLLLLLLSRAHPLPHRLRMRVKPLDLRKMFQRRRETLQSITCIADKVSLLQKRIHVQR